ADRVALMKVLAMILLAIRDDRLGFAELREHHHDLAALDLLHLAREQLADLVAALLAYPRALPLAHPLDDPLLGRLHRRAAEGLERHFLLEHVADLEVRVLEPRLLERHLRPRILDVLHHRAQHDDADRALEFVNPDLGAHVGPVALHQRRVQAVFQQVEQLRALQMLGAGQLANCGDHLARVRHTDRPCSQSTASRASRIPVSGTARASPPGGWSTTVAPSGTATIRARTRPHPATVACTSRPTNRTQCSGQRSGRSSPGLDTSST